jgi:hypothetical protein
MSKHPSDRSPLGEGKVQQAFAEAASTLDLELETPPSPAKEPRMVGAFAPAAHVTTDTDTSAMPDTASTAESEIQALIETWENTSREDLVATAKEVTTDPYCIIKPKSRGGETVETISHEAFEEHVGTDDFQVLYSRFTPKEPRRVTIGELNIQISGPYIASVTYNTTEEGENGTYKSDVVAVTVNEPGSGWKYAVYTKHAETHDS